MTDTANWADIVLPATTWYEKTDLTATPLHPFLQIQQPAIPPVGESRSELWMWQEIVKRIDPAVFAEHFNMTEEQAIRRSSRKGGPTEGITLDQLKAGPVRLKVPDPDVAFVRQMNELMPVPAAVAPGGRSQRPPRSSPPGASSSTRRRTASCELKRDGPHLQGAARRRASTTRRSIR